MTTRARSKSAIAISRSTTVELKLEVVVIPVADVERAKRFYAGLGWRLDADFAVGAQFRIVQFTPPGSSCSIHFGTGVTDAVPGSARSLYLVVTDIEAARVELVGRDVDVSDVFHRAVQASRLSMVRIRSGAVTPRSPRSTIPTETAGCFRKLPCDCPDAWTPTERSAVKAG